MRDHIARDRGHLDKGGALLNLHPLVAAPIVQGKEKLSANFRKDGVPETVHDGSYAMEFKGVEKLAFLIILRLISISDPSIFLCD